MISTLWKILTIRPGKSFAFLVKLLGSLCVYDEQGLPIYVSQRFLKLIRANAEEVCFFNYFLSESVQLTTLTDYWKLALQGETVWFLSTLRDTHEYIECSLQFNPDLKLMFLTAKKLSQSEYVRQLTQEYERLILMLFNHPGVATALMGLDGIVIQGNQRFHQLLGTNKGETIQTSEFIHPEDRLIDYDLQQKLLSGNIDSYTTEKRLIAQNNEIIWADLSVSLINLPVSIHDRKKYFAISFEDITENKKIYSALVRTEGKWKTFVLNSLNLFIQTSSAGQIVYTSPAVERILGYEGEELLDLYVSEFIHPNDLNEFELALRLWSSESKSSESGIECRWKAKSGLWVCLYIQGQRFPLSLEIDGLIIDGYDITDRKFLEAELRSSEEKFKSLILNLPGAVFQCDSTYRIKFISDGIQEITGYSASEFINDRVRYISIIHPDDVESAKNAMTQSVLNDHPCSIDYRIIHANGKVRWVSERRQGTFNHQGKLSWFDGILVDVSDRKQAEEDLRRSEAINREWFRCCLIY